MNKTVEKFIRDRLLELLGQCSVDQQLMFKRMYAQNRRKRIVEEPESIAIKDVVKEMDSDKLDRALTQVENTVARNIIAAAATKATP